MPEGQTVVDTTVRFTGSRNFSLASLTVKNFRCFREMSIEFNGLSRHIKRGPLDSEGEVVAPLTVLVAKNGMGKTAVLDAIRILFGTYTSAFPSKSLVSADANSIRLQQTDDGRTEQADALSIEGDVYLNGEVQSVSRMLSSSEGARTTSKDVKLVADYGKRLYSGQANSNRNWPILAFYGTGRLWVTSKETQRQRMLLKRRDYGYKDCLAVGHNFRGVNKWLTQAVNQQRTSERDDLVRDETVAQQLSAISKALNQVLQPEGYRADLTFDSYTQSLAIRKEIGEGRAIPMPISLLSDGVKAAWGLFADIAFRCIKLNPGLGVDAPRKTEGVVLIDEVDLHLHPSWQQKILNALQLAFPKIQFVVTTHSPQVISSVPRECVRVIQDDTICASPISTEGAKASQVLEEVFGVPSRVSSALSKVASDLEEYKRLVYSEDWDGERAHELKMILGEVLPSDPELTELSLEVLLRDYQRRHQSEAR